MNKNSILFDMNNSQDKCKLSNDHKQNILQSMSKFKVEFKNEREECKKLREINSKLEVEVKEARELEKSHRYHLLTSREMIGNLQDTVSQLVYLKRELKKIKETISSKDAAITAFEKDKQNILESYEESMNELRRTHEKEIAEIAIANERKIQQIQHDSDTQVAQYGCTIEEMKIKLKETEVTHAEKMNMVVLEYEEKIQRGAVQLAQLQDQITRQTARSNTDLDAYRRRLEELEEKLKQNQFKHFLAQSSYSSQSELQVERPYSVNKNPYTDDCSFDTDPVLGSNRSRTVFTQNKAPKTGALQVMYSGKTQHMTKGTDKKGQFNVIKKRKLYNDKDFQDN